MSNTITLPSKFFFQMSINHEFVSTGLFNFKLIFWQITKMIICRYSEEVWSVLVGSIVWYRVSRDNQLYAELCSPRGCSIVSNYYHKLRKLVGGDSFRELELGKWVTITITFLIFFSIYQKHAWTSQRHRSEVENWHSRALPRRLESHHLFHWWKRFVWLLSRPGNIIHLD